MQVVLASDSSEFAIQVVALSFLRPAHNKEQYEVILVLFQSSYKYRPGSQM